MQLTSRDRDIFDFVNEFRVVSSSTLSKLFFTSDSRCRRRLKQLYTNKRIKRLRLSINRDYVYYFKLPQNPTYIHYLLVTDFYGELLNHVKVISYHPPKLLGFIKPDAYFAYKDGNKIKLGCLEVELSSTFDYQKYERFYETGEYKKWFSYMPPVYIVSKYATFPEKTPIKFIKINPDMNNFKLID